MDADHVEAMRREFHAQVRRFEEAKARLQVVVDQIGRGRTQREALRNSAFARLQARLDSMPVIEQAKGILMAQRRCGPDEAYDLLRRASQYTNVKVHVLAAQIVERTAASGNGSNVAPSRWPTGGSREGARGPWLPGPGEADRRDARRAPRAPSQAASGALCALPSGNGHPGGDGE